MKTFRNFLVITALTGFLFSSSCTEYLDVVPDNVMTLDNVYGTYDDAWRGLAKMYSYLPHDFHTHRTTWTLGDEYIGRLDGSMANNTGELRAIRIMRGLQSTSGPQLNFWSSNGTGNLGGARPLYEGIRNCNVFLQEIKNTRNLPDDVRTDWEAQVLFLRAYYHFLLVRHYGPIVIMEDALGADAMGETLFPYRSKVEDCFNFIISEMRRVIPDMPENRGELEMGMLDATIGQAILARVMLFRASPFYSGNREFYDDFVDPRDRQPFFPVRDTPEQTRQKWQEALVAVDEAIRMAYQRGVRLYQYPDTRDFLVRDRQFAAMNEETNQRMRDLYTLRMRVVDPWNEELIWAYSNIDIFAQGELAHATNMRKNRLTWVTQEPFDQAAFSWQWMAATYRMAERYYTKNGLPIEEDPDFPFLARFDAFTTPDFDYDEPENSDPRYAEVAGLLQPNFTTINLYNDRELRFYSDLAFTGGWFRTHFDLFPTVMYQGTSAGMQVNINSTDFYATGVGIQKLVHPESRSEHWQRQVKYPYPIIRLADLYLMRAEILNEIKDAPDNEVWEAINVVRRRAKVPDVQVAWANARNTPNKHTTKQGMRDIILEERGIELSFEGSRYWDMIRHKRAHIEFASSIRGWNVRGSDFANFFGIAGSGLSIIELRRFSIRDYLWPIRLDELNTNGNLVQNPDW